MLEESDDDSDFDDRVLGGDTESVSKEEPVLTRKLQMQSKRPTRSGCRKLKYNYNEESSEESSEDEEEAIDTTKQSAPSTRSGRKDDRVNVSKDGSDSDDSSINEAIDNATQSARSTDGRNESKHDSGSDDSLIDADEALEKQRDNLRKKKMASVRQENHEKELKAVKKDLAEGLKRIQNNLNPSPTLLKTALIMSKGTTPTPKAKDGKQTRRNLLEILRKEGWERTTHFTESDKNELDAIEKQLYSM